MNMKKVIVSLAVAFAGLFATTSANATVYFQSDFNGLADSTKVINGGLLSLTAYGVPNQYGIVRDNALTIYGGDQYNGANSARLVGLGTDLANGLSLLRMTGEYRTKSSYSGAAFAQTAEIQYQNNSWYSSYNSLAVNTVTPGWTAFTLDLNLAGMATDVPHIDMVNLNFFIGGGAPGEFQVDNLKVETIAVAAIPEPSVASLLGFGALGLIATRFRRRS
jgi:hypothetical protein